jgi:nickel/cobalt exporter
MHTLVSIQQWLYQSMGQGLGDLGGGTAGAIVLAMAAAVLFGAVHALMPGHGKTVLISYHLGKETRPIESFTNGAIVALTHVGLAVLLVLGGFAVISRAFAYGGRTPHFEMASGALILLIGAYLLWRSLRSAHVAASSSGRTLALVTGMIPCPLTTFIMSYALARGVIGAGLLVTAAMAVGMVLTVAGITVGASLARRKFVEVLKRSETLRYAVGRVLEIGGSIAVIVFGLWTIRGAQ